MPDRQLIEITVTKFIPAQKWKVIRLITKVWDFPEYIPCVKEAALIQKLRHKMTTKWRVQIDKVPISWIEEDILRLNQDAIYFRSIEGDLQEFRGEWRFKSVPQGTEVNLNVYIRVGIPIIAEFTDDYVKKLVQRSFEAILEAVERRLISIRYSSYKHGNIEKVAGFGIIGHLYNFYHLEKILKMISPNFKMPSREFLGQLFNLTPSFKLYDILNFKSKLGQTVNGCVVIATFIPDMLEKDIWAIFSKVVKACRVAEKYGVGIVTLGGFTSIVAERIGQEVTKEVDVAVTTGNTFTAAMTIEGVLKAARLLNKDISSLKLTIVGGTGDIGSACARALADKVRQLTITGRTEANLRRLRGELVKRHSSNIIATTNNESAVKDADIVICAASATASIINIDWFKPGAIICDVGYPKNVSYAPTSRQDIFIFSGGLAKSPTPISLPIDVGLPSQDTLYGCFSEAIILALEKRYENFSFGRGNITPEKIEEISYMGKTHGFEVADFYWGDRLIDAAIIERVKDAT